MEIPADVWIVIAAVLGLTNAAAVVVLWNEFVRSPWRTWRLRRAIARMYRQRAPHGVGVIQS